MRTQDTAKKRTVNVSAKSSVMTGSGRDRKDWITGTTKVQTALHTNMYLPNHENRDRLGATGEVFVYAKPLRTTGGEMASVPIFLTGFRGEQNPNLRPHDEIGPFSLGGIRLDYGTTANIYSHLEYGAKLKSADKISEALTFDDEE